MQIEKNSHESRQNRGVMRNKKPNGAQRSLLYCGKIIAEVLSRRFGARGHVHGCS
jgi:hypothetical protein